MDISELLMFAIKSSASDVHLSSGEPPLIRVHGTMRKVKSPVLSRDDVHKMLYEIMNEKQIKTFEETHELDFSIELGEIARFRVNCFLQRRGEAAAFRQIPTEVMDFEQLQIR